MKQLISKIGTIIYASVIIMAYMFEYLWYRFNIRFRTKQYIIKNMPAFGFISQHIIQNSDIWNKYECIGANTLKAGLEKDLLKYVTVKWFNSYGSIKLKSGQVIKITTEENIEFMDITKPQCVTFKILQDENNRS